MSRIADRLARLREIMAEGEELVVITVPDWAMRMTPATGAEKPVTFAGHLPDGREIWKASVEPLGPITMYGGSETSRQRALEELRGHVRVRAQEALQPAVASTEGEDSGSLLSTNGEAAG
jgi:hypothetical protein